MQDRVDNFERNSFEIFTQMQVYVKRIARTRDEADILVKMFIKLAESEGQVSKSFRSGVSSFACHFSTVQDYRNAQIERLEKRVISEMTTIGEACKTVRESIRKIFLGKESEAIASVAAGSTKNASGSKTFASALPQLHAIQVDRFEEKKLTDLKVCICLISLLFSSDFFPLIPSNETMQRLLCDMVKIEMLFHAKAIETLTQGFTALHSMNEAEDLNEFRRTFKLATFLPSLANDLASDPTAALMQSSLSNLSLSGFSQSDSSTGKDSKESNVTDSHDEDGDSSDSVDNEASLDSTNKNK